MYLHIPARGCSSAASSFKDTKALLRANAGDLDMPSIPGPGRSPGGGNPLQYSCLENPMDREAWQATVHRVAKRQT